MTRHRSHSTIVAPKMNPFRVPCFLLALSSPQGPAVLGNQTRNRIYETIRENPGIHLREIARTVRMDTNHTKYHLAFLEQHGLVSGERIYGHWAFFPVDGCADPSLDALDDEKRAHLFLLRKEVPRRIVEDLMEHGEADHERLLVAVQLSPSTLYYHIRRLAQKEVIVSRKIGRTRHWRVASPETCRRVLKSLRRAEPVSAPQEARPTVETPDRRVGSNGRSRWHLEDGLVQIKRQ